MDYRIRPFKNSDLKDLHKIRSMRGVMETIPSLFSETESFTDNFYQSFDPDWPSLCAATGSPSEERCIGHGMLVLNKKARLRHTATISLIVDNEFHNVGIGRALLTQLLEIADKWLMLVRVEIEVQAENVGAIHLYESLGFRREGLLKYAFMQDGRYTDILIMGRYNFHQDAFSK